MPRLIPFAAAAALALATPGAAQEDATDEARSGPVDTRDAAYLQVAEDLEVRTGDDELIGTIEDVLLDADGRPAGYVIGIDGFLGIFDRDVQVPMESLAWNESHFVSKMTEEQLENLAPWDE